MNVRLEYFQTALAQEFFDLFAGEKIGDGIARQVYEYRGNSNLVIKIETAANSFQNVMEWEVWNNVKSVKGISRWFAPCRSVSPCGVVLIQARASDISIDALRKRLSRVPDVFTDLKADNWGMIDNRIVCRDYGRCLAISNGIRARTKKADWWQ